MDVPDELRFTAEHEWVRHNADSGLYRVGITDFAQDALGDVVFVDLPEVGAAFQAGEAIGELESTKSVSELYAPMAGKVATINHMLSDNPQLLNEDPYGDGWLVEIDPDDVEAVEALLDASAYRALTESLNGQ